MERQKHGFIFQKEFIENNHLIPEKNYVSEWDAYTSNNIPVQIKTYKVGGELDLGDLKRNLCKDSDFYLVCAEHDGNIILNIRIFFVKRENWLYCFNCSDDILNEMYSFLENISNDYKDDERWRQGMISFKKVTEGIAVPRFKRDHKKQKRIQAAIPRRNIEIFFKLFEEVENLV